MRKLTGLKYVVTISSVGLALLLIGSGTYASAGQQAGKAAPDREALYAADFSEEADDGAVRLSAGAGAVLDERAAGMPVQSGTDFAESGAAAFSDSTNGFDDGAVRLSAGAGAVLDENMTQESAPDGPLRLSAGIGTVLDAVMDDMGLVAVDAETSEAALALAEPVTYWGYTNLGIAHVDNHLNIRQEPSEDGKLVGKLSKDAACEILEVNNGWAHIKSGKVEGYCSMEYLYTGKEAVARGKEAASMIAVVNTQTLKVREEPNTDCAVITLIPEGEELEVVDVMANGWVKFLLDDEEAYVSGEYVNVEERLEKAVTLTELLYGQGVSDVRVALVQYAKQFIGNPYVWGGTSLTNGADCSGFTLSIYKKYGINLPHHAASQAQLGTKISAAEAQPGDLVFYSKNGSINHVAIYIGGGQVIHASSPKTGIKISGMNYRTIACIRRYL